MSNVLKRARLLLSWLFLDSLLVFGLSHAFAVDDNTYKNSLCSISWIQQGNNISLRLGEENVMQSAIKNSIINITGAERKDNCDYSIIIKSENRDNKLNVTMTLIASGYFKGPNDDGEVLKVKEQWDITSSTKMSNSKIDGTIAEILALDLANRLKIIWPHLTYGLT